MAGAQVPVIVEPEAAQRIARRCLQRQIDLCIDWVRENVGELVAIRVTAPSYPQAKPDQVQILAHRTPESEMLRFSLERDYISWLADKFPECIDNPVFMWTRYVPMPEAKSA